MAVCPGTSELVESPANTDGPAAGVAALSLEDEFHDASDGSEPALAAASPPPPPLPPPPPTVLRGQDEFGAARAVYHCNRAACLQQLGREEEVLRECDTAVALHPAYAKAFMRRGQAFEALARYADAVADI